MKTLRDKKCPTCSYNGCGLFRMGVCKGRYKKIKKEKEQ